MCDSHKRKFKYYPEDFGDLTVQVKHMDLQFDVFEDRTVVDSVLHVVALEELESLDLNAKELEVLEVKVEGVDVEYKIYPDQDLLELRFDRIYNEGEKIRIYTKTICRPTENILEGLYYDVTPSNCPRTQITQCQQWGFQRIVPCIDDMTAKCTYKTTIIADSRYTDLLTNGDVIEEIVDLGGGRSKIVYDNSVTPMATYLFFLGVGTYDKFSRRFVYPDGGGFNLELLVPPNSDKQRAEIALDVLEDAIMWVYLYTGPDTYKNKNQADKLWKLFKNRKSNLDVDAELKYESEGYNWGYRYTGTVYREIGMQNSDFGGMENVGNTTILTNRIMPFEDMTDGGFQYMISVKVHEYYHNLNGSEVTGRSPFEIWLNEAVTVFMEQQYARFLWGEDFCRLDEYIDIVAPNVGTMAQDKSAVAMPIEPDGFNDTNELITGVTYVKAPEFVRMIETLIGKEKFVKGLDRYHTRFKHSNASRADWVKAMEEVSGYDLSSMAKSWLKKLRYPVLKVEKEVTDSKLHLTIRQTNVSESVWEFPLVLGLYNLAGDKVEEKVVHMRNEVFKLSFDLKGGYGFVSFNTGFSAFVEFVMDVYDEELYRQLYLDEDAVGRFSAWNALQEKVKVGLCNGVLESTPDKFLDAWMEKIQYSVSDTSMGSLEWVIFEGVNTFGFADRYKDLYEVKKRMKKDLADKFFEELMELWGSLENKPFKGFESEIEMIKLRQVKNGILSILVEVSDVSLSERVWEMVEDLFTNGCSATDRNVALSLYANSGRDDVKKYLMSKAEWAKENQVRLETYLGVLSSIDDAEILIDVVESVMKKDWFDINQSSHQRALLVGFARNRKVSLETEEGVEFLKNIILKLSKVNEFTTLHILSILGQAKDMRSELKLSVKSLVEELIEYFADGKYPSVENNLKSILSSFVEVE